MLFGRRKPGFTMTEEEIKEQELANLSEEIDKKDERTRAEMLADFIRFRSSGSSLTSKQSLLEDDPEIDELLKQIEEDKNTQDIVRIEGDRDNYFYSNENMSDNYAMIAYLVEEGNKPKTIAEMVRWSAKTYPTPTPLDYFNRSPYNYTDEEIETAVEKIKEDEEYEDIGEVITSNKVRYLYSTLYMSDKYAVALAESVESELY